MKSLWQAFLTFIKNFLNPPVVEPSPVKPVPPLENVVPIKLPSPTVLDLSKLKKGTLEWYERAFEIMEFDKGTEIRVSNAARRVLQGRIRYEFVEKMTGIPWYLIGALHNMEASCNFNGCMHNGELIIGTDRKTTLVPKGRGPFKTWEESAIDAFHWDGLAKVKEWSIGMCLKQAELYNGSGYLKYHPMENSPYLWACTTINDGRGKYVADGKWSDTAETNNQVGVAAIIKQLELLGEVKRSV